MTLTLGPFAAPDVDVEEEDEGLSACLATDELCIIFGVLKPEEGLLPAAC